MPKASPPKEKLPEIRSPNGRSPSQPRSWRAGKSPALSPPARHLGDLQQNFEPVDLATVYETRHYCAPASSGSHEGAHCSSSVFEALFRDGDPDGRREGHGGGGDRAVPAALTNGWKPWRPLPKETEPTHVDIKILADWLDEGRPRDLSGSYRMLLLAKDLIRRLVGGSAAIFNSECEGLRQQLEACIRQRDRAVEDLHARQRACDAALADRDAALR